MNPFKRLLGVLALAVGLSACQVTVTYTTTIAQDRSGSFSFQIALDEEATAQFAGQPTPSLFRSLQDEGWEIDRTEDGPLVLSASRSFDDLDQLSEVFEELRGARESGGAGEFGGVNLTLNASQNDDPVSTETRIDGSLDFGPLQDLDAAAKAEFGRAIAFKIVADMPGDPIVSEGDADIDEEGRVVWLPRFGEPMSFSATSTVREPTLFIGLLLGGGALLLIVVAALIGGGRRRRRRDALEAFQIEESHGFDHDDLQVEAQVPVDAPPHLDASETSPAIRRDPFTPSDPFEEWIYADEPTISAEGPIETPSKDDPDPFA